MRSFSRLFEQFRVLRWVLRHPLNKSRKLWAIVRWLKWHIGSRLVPGPVAVPFAGSTRMLVQPGMTGATVNLYTGLADLSEMALVIHLLRPGDLFVDVGANVGSYSILASGVAGARSLAVEPVARTYSRLQDNVRLNNLEDLVRTVHAGVGRTAGVARFSVCDDSTNHVLGSEEMCEGEEAGVTTLDELIDTDEPCLLKIDVEGYEGEVLAGGELTLSRGSLRAIIIEFVGHGRRYGHDETALARDLVRLGFRPYEYLCFERALVPLQPTSLGGANAVFLRDLGWVTARVETAPTFKVHGSMI